MRDYLKKNIGAAARNIFAIAVIGGFIYYLIEKGGTFNAVLDISWFSILLIGVGVFFTWFINSIQAFILLRAENVTIGLWENFMLSTATNIANYLPMRTGTIMRLRYLKAVHGLRYTRTGSLMGIRMVIIICTTGILGMIGTIGLFFSGNPFSIELAIFFTAMIIVSIVACWMPKLKFRNQKNPLLRIWTDFLTGFEALRKRPSITLQVFALMLLQFVVISGRLYLTFDIVQFHPSLWVLLLLAPLTSLVPLLVFTPGGSMGIREGIFGYITMVIGYDFNSGFFAGAVDRAVIIFLTLILGTAGVIYVLMRLKRAAVKNNSSKEKKCSYNAI